MTLLGKIVPEQEGRQDSILANQQAFCLLGKHSDCEPGSCQLSPLFNRNDGSVVPLFLVTAQLSSIVTAPYVNAAAVMSSHGAIVLYSHRTVW